MKLGKPKYEQNNKNYFSFGKDKNHFILRILPPMGKLADKGKWSQYHAVEFGHVGTDNRMKPFLSPRVVNFDRMVEVESALHVRRVDLEGKMAEAKKAGNTAVEAQLNTFLRKYNQDRKHYMNAIDLQGNIGLFKVGTRGFNALKAAIEALRSEGVDPVGIDNGRFFVFQRSGKGTDTLYTVQEYKQKSEIDGPTGKVLADLPFPHAITEGIMNKLDSDAFELLDVFPAVTVEEEAIIMTGPEGVDKVFNAKRELKKAEVVSTVITSEAAPVATIAPTPAPEVALTPAPVEPTPAPVAEVPLETVALDPVTEAALTPAPVTEELTDAEFLAKIERGEF